MKKIVWLLIALAIVCHAIAEADEDRRTYSNYRQFSPQKIDLDITMDFDSKFINGVSRLRFMALQKNIKVLSLDIGKGLTYSEITIEKKGDKVKVLSADDINRVNQPLGDQLNLKVGTIWSEIKEGDEFYINISYQATFDNSRYIVYENATSHGSTIQYFYVICKPFCRNLLPLMDTSIVKTPLSIEIEHPPEWAFFTSGKLVNSNSSVVPGYIHDEFDQGKAIPASAITIYGATSWVRFHDTIDVYIVSEPYLLEDIVLELGVTLSNQIMAIEAWLNLDLPFEVMQIIFPHKSFPFFDLQAGYSSYVSKTVLTGDGNETHTIARTVARQYFGSSLVAQNCSNTWITEGLVAFMERKIIELTRGEIYASTESMLGNHTLYMEMLEMGMDSNFTKLVPYIADYQDPWEHATSIPREKGYQFFKQMELVMNNATPSFKLENGVTIMQSLIRDFLKKYTFVSNQQTLDYVEFKRYWQEWTFQHIQNPDYVIGQIDYDQWMISPGMPQTDLNFENELYEESRNLAEAFLELGGRSKPANWHTLIEQKVEFSITFLDYLVSNWNRMTTKIFKQLDRLYTFSDGKDLKLASIWFSLAILSKQSSDLTVFLKIDQFLSGVGSIELIAPVYKAFNRTNQRTVGCDLLKDNSAWLHPMTLDYFQPLRCPLAVSVD